MVTGGIRAARRGGRIAPEANFKAMSDPWSPKNNSQKCSRNKPLKIAVIPNVYYTERVLSRRMFIQRQS
jgi:hypothetical protein